MKENKISTYILYAIGETLLVVVGILIAVSIDNWNNDLQDHQEINKLLFQMRVELNNEIEVLRNDSLTSSYEVNYLRKLKNGEYDVDFDEFMEVFATYYTYSNSFSLSYNSLKEKGLIEKIENDSLKIQIIRYNEVVKENMISFGQWSFDLVTNKIEPFIIDEFPLKVFFDGEREYCCRIFRTDATVIKEKLNSSQKLNNLINLRFMERNSLVDNLVWGIEEGQKLFIAINLELDN